MQVMIQAIKDIYFNIWFYILKGDVKMVKTKKVEEITINSHFTSKTDEEIALNMSKIIAKLINRDLENVGDTEEKEEKPALSI